MGIIPLKAYDDVSRQCVHVLLKKVFKTASKKIC